MSSPLKPDQFGPEAELRQSRPMPSVYGRVAKDYQLSGLGSPLPIKPRQKSPPPRGFTGRQGKWPTPGRVRGWVRNRPRHNVALRLASGVLGLDVDAYAQKVGGRTLALAQERFGPLPMTVRSSARRDGVSGIYLFRVPPRTAWPPVLAADLSVRGPSGHVELVHAGLRYLVCWPSVHPNGDRYWWWDQHGKLTDVPRLQDLPDLPDRWVAGLQGMRGPDAAASKVGQPDADVPDVGQPAGSPDATALSAAAGSVTAAADVVRSTTPGRRNEVLNRTAYSLGGYLGIDEAVARKMLVQAACDAGLTAREATRTFTSGWSAGRGRPRP